MELAATEERETDSRSANEKAENCEQQAAESTVAQALEEGLGLLINLQRAPSFVPTHQKGCLEARTECERMRSMRNSQIARQLQRSLASAVENSNFLLELRPEMIALNLQVVARLQVEPEAVTGTEIASETERRVRRDGAGAMNNRWAADGTSNYNKDTELRPVRRRPLAAYCRASAA